MRTVPLIVIVALAFAMPTLAQLELFYNVTAFTPSGVTLLAGSYRVVSITPQGVIGEPINLECFLEPVCSVIEVLLEPPEKFVFFEPRNAKPIGPGALGFPNGIIPCEKYLVHQGGISYEVCSNKNIVVYENYIGRNFGATVVLYPYAGSALRVLPWITDPASPIVKGVLALIMFLTATSSIYVFVQRDRVEVV